MEDDATEAGDERVRATTMGVEPMELAEEDEDARNLENELAAVDGLAGLMDISWS